MPEPNPPAPTPPSQDPRPAQPPPPPAPQAPPAPELPPAGPDEVALLIDGRPVVVKKGKTVLQAAESAGIAVPHYCYHPGLSIAGNCRMCLVEIEKMPKLQIGCATQATQGMVVRTTTPRVRTTREGIMEFLLINHPLDCPICDQAGECRLQEYADDYGAGRSRFEEEKIHHEKRVPIGAQITFDGERCIKCTRCIRFCDEISKTHELGLFERGGHAIIGAFPGKPLDNPYSGNTVDVCPVGALTWNPFRFRARVWFLRNTLSTCAACARGCNVNVAVYDQRIHRITPRPNLDVNAYWMCDVGRQSYAGIYQKPRLERPTVDGQPATPDQALDRAAAALREVVSRYGADAVVALVSARLTVEDLFMAREVLGAASVSRLIVPPHEEGEDDPLLIRKDKTGNKRGAALLGLPTASPAEMARAAEAIAQGTARALVAVGEDPVGDQLVAAAAAQKLDVVIALDWWKSPTVQAAHVALPLCGYGEHDGVLVNFQGRAQRARRAVRPHALAEPAWRHLLELGRRFGYSSAFARTSDVFDAVAAQVEAFAGLSHRAIGERGRLVAGATSPDGARAGA